MQPPLSIDPEERKHNKNTARIEGKHDTRKHKEVQAYNAEGHRRSSSMEIRMRKLLPRTHQDKTQADLHQQRLKLLAENLKKLQAESQPVIVRRKHILAGIRIKYR